MPGMPIDVAPLFPEVSRELIHLLRSLSDREWNLPTISSQRTVKDIASHLLDGSMRRLSIQRDGYRPAHGGPRREEPLLDFLNRLNAEWETGTRRLSPRVIMELNEWADPQLADLFASLDPHGPAIFPVAWAGASESENWMDVARDYTEKWHHTQQIFEATGRPSTIMNARLGRPAFEIFLRALPFALQAASGESDTCVSVVITGEAGGSWHVVRKENGWDFMAKAPENPAATITIDQDAAWKLFTKRRSLPAIREAFPQIRIGGDPSLAQHFLLMVSVMA